MDYSRILASLIVGFGVVVVNTIAIIWSGYVLMLLWGWFVVPLFALPALGLINAIGIMTIVGLTTKQYVSTNGDNKHEFIASMFMRPAVALVIGFIAHLAI